MPAQKKSGGGYPSIDIYYGYRTYFQKFYNQLNTADNINLNRPLQVIGIGASSQYAVSRNGSCYGRFIYNQVVPQTIIIRDSIKGKITGFVLSAAFGRIISTKKEILSLFFYFGLSTGRLKIYDNELTRQKNPFFSPKVGLQPKIKLGKICISFILDYEYDLSKSTWRRTIFSSSDKININTLRQTGITGQLGIGYILK